MASQLGLIAVLDSKEVRDQEQAKIAATRAMERGEAESSDPYAGMVQRLAAYIETCWQAAKNAKESDIEPKILRDIRQREGEYDADKMAAIRASGGSEIYVMLTNSKCRAATGWIRDTMFQQDERPFTIKPSPVPSDLPMDVKQGVMDRAMGELEQALAMGIHVTPEQVYQRSKELYDRIRSKMREEAKTLAARMEDTIDDLLVEGQWYDALESMIPDMVCMPAAFIKGPVIRKKSRLKWVQGPSGKMVPQAEDELVPIYYSPSALDIYPAPDSRGIEDGYLFERISLRRSALYRMIGVPGYKDEAIKAALAEYHKAGHDLAIAGDQLRRDLENSTNWQMTPDHSIDSLEFHGSVRGEWLLEWGMPAEQVPDPDEDYEVTCLKVGRFVVRCVLNDDPLRRRIYDKCSYDEIKGQFWGRGLPPLIRDCQDVCNAAARATVNNMGMSSGPMVEVEVDRLAEGEDITTMYPWRIFQVKSSKTTPSPAIRFFMPPIVVNQLMEVFNKFSSLADTYSGIPQFEQGVNPTQGAAGTASGLSMLMGSASRLARLVLAGVDRCIVGSVTRAHTFIMLFRPDAEDAKGDANIVARGSSSLVSKEQLQIRRTEFMTAVMNPIDQQIIGPLGRAELLRDSLKTLEFDPDDIVPQKDEMLSRMQQEAQAQQQIQAAEQQGQGKDKKPQATDPAGAPAGGQAAGLF
ncbi:MAG: hypothetical protein IPL86_15845 [Flavobacteriales bacterium]|nr:hypothetical protein [Flavobacteriales bacterium]